MFFYHSYGQFLLFVLLLTVYTTTTTTGPEFRVPDITKPDYRPEGALMGSTVAADTAMLLQLPASVVTLLGALARVRLATEDLCGCGFLERMIERFYTASITNPENDLKVWGECALFFGRVARGGKNVKGYGSCNEVLVRSAVIPKLISMFSRQQKQHRRVRLHAMLAVSALMEDSLMSAPIVMSDNMALAICMKVATDAVEIEPIRRQALLIIRSISSFPNERYFMRLRDMKVIPPLQTLGRSFAGEVGSANSGNKTNGKKERKVIQTGSGEASSDPSSLSLPSLGQLARDILENMGAAIEEDEKAEKKEPEVTPWGANIPVNQHWVPFKERNLTDFEREALFYEKEVEKDPPTFVVGETLVHDYGRYVVMRIDHTPNPPDVPLYDLAHCKTDTMGKVIVNPLRFEIKKKNITEEMIHLFQVSQNDCSAASVDDGGLPHHDAKSKHGGHSKKKKKKQKKHHHHHHHHHYHQDVEEEEGPEFVMIKDTPEALKRELLKTNPHFKLQQPILDKVDQQQIELTPRKPVKQMKLYQYKDEVIEKMINTGSISKNDVLNTIDPSKQITYAELSAKPKVKKKKKRSGLLPSELRRLKRLEEDKEQLIHCQLDGCQFRAKTFAHLSLHCALVHFKSEQPPASVTKRDDDGLLDLRAPPNSSRMRMLQHAQKTLESMSESMSEQQMVGGDAGQRQRRSSQRRRTTGMDTARSTTTSSSLSKVRQKKGRTLDDSAARFRPILLDPVFPPVAPPGAPPTLHPTKEPKWPLVYDYVEHRVELSGHEISIYTSTNGRPNSKRESAPWRGAVPTREKSR